MSLQGVATALPRPASWLRTGLWGARGDLAPGLAAELARFVRLNRAGAVGRMRLLVALLLGSNLLFWLTDPWLVGHNPGALEALHRGRSVLTAVGLASIAATSLPPALHVACGWLAGGLVCGTVAWTFGQIGGPSSAWFHYTYLFLFLGLLPWLSPGHRIALNSYLCAVVALVYFGLWPEHRRDPLAGSAFANLLFAGALATLLGLYLDHMRLRVFLLGRSQERHLAALGAQVAAQTRHIQGLLDHIEDRQERERRALAAELHDEMGQVLTAMRCVAKVGLDRLGPDRPAELEQLAALLAHATRSLRDLLTRLRPRILDDLGLGPAVEWQARQLAQAAQLRLHLALPPQGRLDDLPEPVATVAFRVVQESLTNVVRHARADAVTVRIQREPAQLVVEVEDDGVGFCPSDTGDRFGILGMTERARALGGQLTVTPHPPRGTRVKLRLPLEAP